MVSVAPPGATIPVILLNDGGSPCRDWSFLQRQGASLWLLGSPASSCPGEEAVLLPALEAGRYRLIAALDDGQIWDQASFAVGAEKDLPPLLVDLSPTTPGPNEPLAIVVSTLDYTFGGAYATFDEPPTVTGDRIVFRGQANYCPILCPPPAPIDYRGHHFVLPPLSVGLKTVVFELYGEVLAERTFTVAPPAQALLLEGGRFELRLEWRDHAGERHVAAGEPLTDLSGHFWFFHPENIELVVKVLDGRPVNGAFWLFGASMTDLGYTLTIIDHDLASCGPSGPCPRTHTYEGAPGTNHNVIDTKLFSP
jgi:hypothetical protein